MEDEGEKEEEKEKEKREVGKLAVWSVSSAKPGNGVDKLRDSNIDTFWQYDTCPSNFASSCAILIERIVFLMMDFFFYVEGLHVAYAGLCFATRSDGAQPHLVNIQFQKKVRLQVVAGPLKLLQR